MSAIIRDTIDRYVSRGVDLVVTLTDTKPTNPQGKQEAGRFTATTVFEPPAGFNAQLLELGQSLGNEMAMEYAAAVAASDEAQRLTCGKIELWTGLTKRADFFSVAAHEFGHAHHAVTALAEFLRMQREEKPDRPHDEAPGEQRIRNYVARVRSEVKW
jgi:hypothetical protein